MLNSRETGASELSQPGLSQSLEMWDNAWNGKNLAGTQTKNGWIALITQILKLIAHKFIRKTKI